MKLLNKVSIRMRITLLTGAILFAISVLFTLSSMYNAQNKFILPNEISLTKNPNTGEVELWQPEKNDTTNLQASILTQVLLAKKQFDMWSYIYLIVFSSIGMIVTYIITGKALKPLQELNDSIINITEHNLKARIPAYIVKDEIGSLVTSYNAMLERLNESFLRQKRFSSNVSHELKTPLSIMNAGLQVLHLDEEPTVEDYKETIDIAERNTKRLINIVEDLFVLTNESDTNFTDEIDLKQLVLQIKAELDVLYNEKKINFIHEFEFHRIIGNGTLIYRALFNLIENAIKYNVPNGKVEIKTVIENDERKVIISDSGMGILKENIDKIFEPFYRVDPSRSRKIGGAGLGLSIVKSIVEKHGWEIEVDSKINSGTQFYISIKEAQKYTNT